MPQPKPLTAFAEAMVRTHYGRRSPQWIGDRLGWSSATVLNYAKQLGLLKPTTGENGGTAIVPAVVWPGTIRPRTGLADFPHPDLGQDFTPSPTPRRGPAGSGVRAQNTPFIPPPTREQLMAGSANLRRVYKIED
jgi:hypothetical protein